jgi:hypothetical protein
MTTTVYSFDSSAMIHAWRRAYRPRNFPTFWERMDELASDGSLRISSEVYNELSRKDDEVFNWCKQRKELIYVDITDAVQERVIEIMQAFPRLVDTKNGKSGGDPFVIALASCGLGISTVVTEENPGGTRIPWVCEKEKIAWFNLADFIETEAWIL